MKEIAVDMLSEREVYNLMISTIVPRPIAWVSTISKTGNFNIAPFSYFTGVCTKPMTVVFCPVLKKTGQEKDTLRNIRDTGIFGISMVCGDNVKQANISAHEIPFDKSEFDYANIEYYLSKQFKLPLVKSSKIAYECQEATILDFGDSYGGGSAVFGTVHNVYMGGNIPIKEDFMFDSAAMDPISRLESTYFGKVGEKFSLPRDL